MGVKSIKILFYAPARWNSARVLANLGSCTAINGAGVEITGNNNPQGR